MGRVSAGLAIAIALVGAAAGQGGFSPGANDYTVEKAENGPLSQEVAFRGFAEPWADLPVANMVVGVTSSPASFQARMAVRTSWAQLQSLTDPKLNRLTLEQKQALVVRFVVGDASDESTAAQLEAEQAKYHDIVRVPVSHADAAKKTGEFLRWAHVTFNYQWVFMTRDDSFVRIDKVLQLLIKQGTEKVYLGKVVSDRPVRRELDSRTPFPLYPAFADGAGYALSHDIADFVVNNLDHLNYPIKNGDDDVAVGNWLSGTNVEPADVKGFHNSYDGCDKDMYVQAHVDPETMKRTFINTVKGVPCHDRPFFPRTDDSQQLISMDEGKLASGEASDEALMGVSDGADEENEEEEDEFKSQMDGNADDGSAFAAKMNAGMGARGAVTLDDAAVKVVQEYAMN